MPEVYPEQTGHAKNSKTSFDAATKVNGSGKITREVLVYEAIKKRPMTVWEVCDALNLPYEVIHPRCFEMKARGILVPTGDTRPTPYKNASEVLRVAAPYSKKKTAKFIGKRRRFEIDIDKLKTARVHIDLLETKNADRIKQIKDIIDEVIAG